MCLFYGVANIGPWLRCIFAALYITRAHIPSGAHNHMFDLFNIAGKVQEVKSRIETVKADLQSQTTEAEAGGGLVKVALTGDYKVQDIQIADELLLADRKEELQDLLVVALNAATAEIKQTLATRIKTETQGLLPNMPGLDLNALLG